jgi:hypothetical protein
MSVKSDVKVMVDSPGTFNVFGESSEFSTKEYNRKLWVHKDCPDGQKTLAAYGEVLSKFEGDPDLDLAKMRNSVGDGVTIKIAIGTTMEVRVKNGEVTNQKRTVERHEILKAAQQSVGDCVLRAR